MVRDDINIRGTEQDPLPPTRPSNDPSVLQLVDRRSAGRRQLDWLAPGQTLENTNGFHETASCTVQRQSPQNGSVTGKRLPMQAETVVYGTDRHK